MARPDFGQVVCSTFSLRCFDSRLTNSPVRRIGGLVHLYSRGMRLPDLSDCGPLTATEKALSR